MKGWSLTWMFLILLGARRQQELAPEVAERSDLCAYQYSIIDATFLAGTPANSEKLESNMISKIF